MLATNGKLYGTCRLGGQHNYGTLFEFDLATSSITVKKHFNYGTGFIGGSPYNAPYQASNGKIYGLYSQGLYAYDMASDSLMLVKYFVSNITGNPGNSSPIVQANDGNLYMSTTSGGKYNYGALVQYNFTLDSLIAVPVHAGVRGMQSQPMQASNGKLYIPTQSIKGICEYTLGTDTLIQKKIISTSRYFLNTQGRLIEANGKLYGTGHYYKSSLSYLYNYDLATDSLTMNRGVIKGYLIGGLTQAVSPTVGLDEEEKATSIGITVYPNPTMDYIQFDLDRKINEIRIYNMRGQLVSQPNPNKNRVEVTNFENGTYIIQLFTDNGVAHSRFIKQ